jgi:branched-chain amino acid transport system substrate-binding protein
MNLIRPVGRRATLVGALATAAILPSARRARADTSPLRIGVLTDMSGWGRDNGGPGAAYAAEAAAKAVGGTVLGRPVEIITGDHQQNPNIGLQIARKWFDEGVEAIADLPNSAIALGVSALAAERNRIALISAGGSSEITNSKCNANTVQFTYDTYALAKVLGSALVADGGKKWFFLTADYTFGHTLERDTTVFVEKAGGTVVGHAAHPSGTADFSAFLIQAQASGADVVALANSGTDCTNALKQAAEFGLGKSGQRMAGLLLLSSDVHGAGLAVAQNTYAVTAAYWGQSPSALAWSRAYLANIGVMPTMLQTGVYGSVLHYLKAVAAAKTTDAPAVMAAMREMPINDEFVTNGYLRKDGRVIRDMYLTRVKTPAQSKDAWDYFEIVRTVKGEDAYRPVSESACPLLKA